jgi:hypothetical protein
MPHVLHIVIKLSDMPNDIEGKIRFIDEYITAKAPPVPTDSTHPDYRRYYCYCNSHVIHGCSTAVNGCKKRHALHVEGDTTVQKLAQHILTIVVSRSINVFQKAV